VPAAAIRLCLDVNVVIAHALTLAGARPGGSATELVEIASEMRCPAGPVQLVMSWEMVATLERVLLRLGIKSDDALSLPNLLVKLMRVGPDPVDPYLVPGGGRALPMRDLEDAGILASAIAARVDLLVTNNLDDFVIKDGVRVDTRSIHRGGKRRQLYALCYERNDGVAIVIAHPIDAAEWLRSGIRPSPNLITGLRGHGSDRRRM
jgi:predicted nucleic acid-binding protein